MKKNALDPLDFFVGGVPPQIIYGIESRNLGKLVDSYRRKRDENVRNRLLEVCFIGLAAYFEAFCKNQFAALINICPQVLNNFTLQRDNSTISLPHLIRIIGDIDHRLGALLAEEYDFGSARTINSLYFDLLRITPFSKAEEARYGEFLSDRNLLVHHGGIYTIKYHGQRFRTEPIARFVHWHSLVITVKDFDKWRGFLNALVGKIADNSFKAISRSLRVKGFSLEGSTRRRFGT